MPFRSCGDLLGYVKSQAVPLVGPWGFGGSSSPGRVPPVSPPRRPSGRADGATPTEGVDYSGTNVQEQGVDEPDLVKTNGTTLFAVAGGRLNAVDVSGARPQLLDSLKLDGGWSHELLLAGDRLLVLSRGGYWLTPLPAATAIARPYSPATLGALGDRRLEPEGVAARSHAHAGRRLRRRAPRRHDGTHRRLVAGADDAALRAADRVDGRSARDSARPQPRRRPVVAPQVVAPDLPIKRAGRPAQAARPLVQCRNVDRPRSFSGLGMLTVLTVDLAKGLDPVDSVGVMTDARIVYASPDNLYLATERWADRPSAGDADGAAAERHAPPSTASTSPTRRARATAAAARCRATC